ncbi:reverse transcriptase domain-containing protein [Tanacetum coccineum]
MEEEYEPTVQHQRRVNPKIHDVIKKEVEKLLDAGLIYPIFDSPWVSPVHCVPKKGGMTVVKNDENDLIPTRLVTGWRVCIDYRKLNEATRKDHFPLPFMDQILERLAGNQFYCFLDGFSGYFQIPIDPKDQEKTTFTCPYGTFAYLRMPFGLCNAPAHGQNVKTCEDSNFGPKQWRKAISQVKECIVLGNKISKSGIEVDRAKVDVIAKLPHPTTVKVFPKFLGHADAKPKLIAVDSFALRILNVVIREKRGQRIWPPLTFPDMRNPHQEKHEKQGNHGNISLETLDLFLLFELIVPHGYAEFANYHAGKSHCQGNALPT